MKNKLLGSAGSKEQLIQMLNRYFYSNISLVGAVDGSFDLLNSKGRIVGFVVKNYKGRWRFEMTVQA